MARCAHCDVDISDPTTQVVHGGTTYCCANCAAAMEQGGSGSDPGTLLTARSADSAVLHLADNTQLMVVTATGAAPLGTTAPPFRDPSMLGFTNPDLGFAIADGALWRTVDGGATWSEEQVVPNG